MSGTTATGDTAWEEWGDVFKSEWDERRTWLSDLGTEFLPSLFSGFSKKWDDPIWKDALGRAIWWYVASHESVGGLDGSLVIIQVALELLSWVVYVESGKIISRQGFEDLCAADQIRLLLQAIGVTQEIPSELKELTAFALKKNWTVGPWAVTAVRNSLVHPKNRHLLDENSRVLYEARELSMWYLELAILHICGYRSKYLNRLRAKAMWQTEDVPWTAG